MNSEKLSELRQAVDTTKVKLSAAKTRLVYLKQAYNAWLTEKGYPKIVIRYRVVTPTPSFRERNVYLRHFNPNVGLHAFDVFSDTAEEKTPANDFELSENDKLQYSFGVYYDIKPKGLMLSGKAVTVKQFEKEIQQQKAVVKGLDQTLSKYQTAYSLAKQEPTNSEEESKLAEIDKAIAEMQAKLSDLMAERKKLVEFTTFEHIKIENIKHRKENE